jgi:hypothetical protein
VADTPYTAGYRAGQKFVVEKVLAYLGTQTSESPIAASFAAEIARMFRSSDGPK